MTAQRGKLNHGLKISADQLSNNRAQISLRSGGARASEQADEKEWGGGKGKEEPAARLLFERFYLVTERPRNTIG